MTLTDFLDSLTIINDASVDHTDAGIISGLALLGVSCIIICMLFSIFREYRGIKFDVQIVFIIIGLLVLSAICIWGAVHLFSAPGYKLEWIISTENTDASLIYQYFEVKSAPISNTVEVTPKSEFYLEILEWYMEGT